MSGLLLYNLGLSNAHPIIISAILNLSPFWAALVALLISRVPIPISPATFFGCFAGAFIGAMVVAWSQLGDANKPTFDELADNFVHGSWVYAIPVPLCSALGGTLVGKWFAKYNESAAIAANFLFANIILNSILPGHSLLEKRAQFRSTAGDDSDDRRHHPGLVCRTRFLSNLVDGHRRRQRLRRDVLELGPGVDRSWCRSSYRDGSQMSISPSIRRLLSGRWRSAWRCCYSRSSPGDGPLGGAEPAWAMRRPGQQAGGRGGCSDCCCDFNARNGAAREDGGFRREVQPRRQHWFLNEKSGFPFRTPAFCSVSRGQRRLGEKEYRAPSVTPKVALRVRTQGIDINCNYTKILGDYDRQAQS